MSKRTVGKTLFGVLVTRLQAHERQKLCRVGLASFSVDRLSYCDKLGSLLRSEINDFTAGSLDEPPRVNLLTVVHLALQPDSVGNGCTHLLLQIRRPGVETFPIDEDRA